MKQLLLGISLLLSCAHYTASLSNVVCPCVDNKMSGSCCCIGSGHACNCVEMFEKHGSVPSTCPCAKQEVTPQSHHAPLVEISYGELFDKITILEIKAAQIADPDKLFNIESELDALGAVVDNLATLDTSKQQELLVLKEKLAKVNWQLWQVEDSLRAKEARKQFDDEFIRLARSVYMLNDHRAALKKEISYMFNSRIIEEKSYPTA